MDEEKFARMEEAREDALEMAKEKNATPQATAEDEEGLRIVMGVWGNTASSRAPVNWA